MSTTQHPDESVPADSNYANPRDAKARAKADKAYRKASRPWFKKKRFWALGLLALLIIMAALSQGDDTDSADAPDTSPSVAAPVPSADDEAAEDEAADASEEAEEPAAEEAEEPAEVERINVTAQELLSALDANALAASREYKDKDVVLTGKFNSVDASGRYFTLRGDDEFTFQSVQVYIEEEHLDTVSSFTADQDVTVTGKITDVGEIMGYSVDAETVE